MATINRSGGAIHYDVTDERLPWFSDTPTIVFHHGVGACADVWRGWTSALMERYRLVRFDMRGHGRSTMPANFNWTIAGMVADLHAVIEATCNSERVHLIGESIGGTVVLAYAIAHTERVRTVSVSNGAHRGGSLTNLDDWAETMGRGGMEAWSAQMMQRRFHPGAISKNQWQWYETQQASANAQAILDAVGVLVGADMTDELAQLTAPVLLMHPDASPFIPIPVMDELRAGLRDAQLRVFPHAKHGLPFSHAGPCAAQVAEFLSMRG
jgi:pimeloyl-ACP methyl ester carboxylesterase